MSLNSLISMVMNTFYLGYTYGRKGILTTISPPLPWCVWYGVWWKWYDIRCHSIKFLNFFFKRKLKIPKKLFTYNGFCIIIIVSPIILFTYLGKISISTDMSTLLRYIFFQIQWYVSSKFLLATHHHPVPRSVTYRISL